MKPFKLAVCQIKTTEIKLNNIKSAWEMLKTVKSKGAEVCVLGEMFNCPYNPPLFKNYSEKLEDSQKIKTDSLTKLLSTSKSPTIDFLKFASKSLNILLIGGSIPLTKSKRIHNTSLIYDKGNLIGSHDKAHLFDINIPGKENTNESKYITKGEKITVLKTRFGNFGIGICYDIRFCDYAMAMRKLKADVLFYPSVFTMTTGPLYFENLGIARALDTQCFVVLSSNARYEEGKGEFMQCWGHSRVIDFGGKVRKEIGKGEGFLLEDVDLEGVREMRRNMPYTEYQVREDLYRLEILKK